MTEQLALNMPLPLPLPSPPSEPPPTYWENRGPRDWRPVLVVVRYGDCCGLAEPVLPHVVTKRLAPRNVAIERPDGHRRVVPVRNLRRQQPA